MLTARQVGGLDGSKMYDGPVISIASVGKIQPTVPVLSASIELRSSLKTDDRGKKPTVGIS
jgi:hypothetical protein